MKVHILGGPGSGKTTLAHDLSALLSIPHHDLDLLSRTYSTQAESIEATVAIAHESVWITEGIYLVVTDSLLYHADYIVFLDIPGPVAIWRILRRHIVNSIRGTNLYPGIRSLYLLVTYARSFYFDKRSDTADTVRAYIETHNTLIEPTVEQAIEDLQTYGILVIPSTAETVRQYLARYHEKTFFIKDRADRQRFFAMLQRTLL